MGVWRASGKETNMSDTVTPTPGQGAPTSPTTPPADPSTAPICLGPIIGYLVV